MSKVTFEGHGERPIEWIVSIAERYTLFLEDPASEMSYPIDLIQDGNAIKITPRGEEKASSFVESHLEQRFTEFDEVPGDMGNSRLQLRCAQALVFVSVY